MTFNFLFSKQIGKMAVCFKNTLQLYSVSSTRRNFSGIGKEMGLSLGIGPDKILPANDYISWNTSNPVKIKMEDSAPGNYPPILVQTMMRYAVSRYGENTALVSHDGQIKWNYNQYLNEVESAAKGFVSLGLTPLHGVGIMAHNHPYWFVSSLAAIFAGGMSCGSYTTNTAVTLKYICEHAPIDLLVIQDRQLLDKLLQDDPELSEIVKSFILIDETGHRIGKNNILTWQELLENGRNIPDSILQEKEKEQAVNQACMLIYTSGTTGLPKGVMLSHDNITWTSRISTEHYDWGNERVLSYLPLSHIAACLSDCYTTLYTGSEVHFADSEALKGTLVENLKRVRPTIFFGVPRVWEKIAEKMQQIGRSNTGIKKAVGNWAKAAATKHHTLVREGKIKHDQASLSYILARKLIFSKIREALGLDKTMHSGKGEETRPFNCSNLPKWLSLIHKALGLHKNQQLVGSAAAPLSVDTILYFQSLDIMIGEFYGSTETAGPQTSSMEGIWTKPGSVGLSYYGLNNTILNPDCEGCGEVATKSRNVFMGYHKEESKTKEVFEDGWYLSGDLGRFDTDGLLWLTGRRKELIITAGGENIPPVLIENNIKAELPELLSNVVVVGDKRKYLTCLVTLKCQIEVETGAPTNLLDDEAIKFCQKKIPGLEIKTIEDFKSHARLNSLIQKAIHRANSKAIANPHKVQTFKILPLDLSLSGGELGPTMKSKRHFIVNKYSDYIAQMYRGDLP